MSIELAPQHVTPLAGALVDLWHCDALGVYSDVSAGGGNPDTRGQSSCAGIRLLIAMDPCSFKQSIQVTTLAERHIYTSKCVSLPAQRGLTSLRHSSVSTIHLRIRSTLRHHTTQNRPEEREITTITSIKVPALSILLNVTPDGQGGYASTFDLGLAGLPASLQSVAAVAATNYSPDALTSDGIAALFGSDLAVTTAAAASPDCCP